jgi:hypothetical protein
MANFTNLTECRYSVPTSQDATSWSEYSSRDSCLYPQNGSQSSLGYPVEESSACSYVAREEEVTLSVMAGTKNKIKVELNNEQLWSVFRERETEMIITRAGRYVYILEYYLHQYL